MNLNPFYSRFGGMFHLVDLVPTLLHLATQGDFTASNQGLDGLDQWNALVGLEPSPRRIMIYNIDDNFVPAVLNGPEVQPKFQIVNLSSEIIQRKVIFLL